MTLYANAVTDSQEQLFPECGSQSIAGAAANTSAIAGENYSLVYVMNLTATQPHDQFGAANNAGEAQHELQLTLPNYQPIQSTLLNIVNEHKGIKSLTIHEAARSGGPQQNVVVGEYHFSDGMLVSYDCTNQHGGSGLIVLRFVFNQVTHDDKVTNKMGLLTRMAA